MRLKFIFVTKSLNKGEKIFIFVTRSQPGFFFFNEKRYLAGHFRQIKRSLAEQFLSSETV